MDRRNRIRRRLVPAAALAMFAGTAGPVAAQIAPPSPFPIPPEVPAAAKPVSPPTSPPASEPVTEVIVLPELPGMRTVPVAPAPRAVVVPHAAPSKAVCGAETFTGALHASRDSSNQVRTAAVGMLNKVAERTNVLTDSRVIAASASVPVPAIPAIADASTPQLVQPQLVRPPQEATTRPAAAPKPSPPAVVVREPASQPQPTSEPAGWFAFSKENVLVLALAGCAAIFAIFGWLWSRRGVAAQQPTAQAVVPDAPDDADVLAFVTALSPDAVAGPQPLLDAEGFAVSVDSPDVEDDDFTISVREMPPPTDRRR